MSASFYIAAFIAVTASVLAVTRSRIIHAILFLIVAFIAEALIFFILGAPFIAALLVITYAGAIMVLFMFAVMLLNIGQSAAADEKKWQPASGWIAPGIMGGGLIAPLAAAVFLSRTARGGIVSIEPAKVGEALLGPYKAGVILAAFLLLAGLLGAYRLGRREDESRRGEGMENGDHAP
jgi:NADH-quinone oxidoreductase subunit J